MEEGLHGYENLSAPKAGKYSYGDNITMADICKCADEAIAFVELTSRVMNLLRHTLTNILSAFQASFPPFGVL